VNRWTKTLRSATATAAATVAMATLVAPTGLAAPTWGTGPVHANHNVLPSPRVVDLRVGRHAHFDRIVIDMHGKTPGYAASYVHRLRYDGSGDLVPLRGRRFIGVSITPATAHRKDGSTLVYTGPDLQQYSLPTLRGVAFMGDFEGTTSFGLSLRRRAAFRVFVLHAPNRLVVDVRH
jgi:hypothetical protein